jgi:hypothetical protein
MRERFGTAFSELPLKRIASGSTFMNAFEDVKRDFRGGYKSDKVFDLPLKMPCLDAENKSFVKYYDFKEDW